MNIDKNINNLVSGKKILIAPLDWGLGHTIRCIPLIETLIKQDNQVYIAVNNAGKDIILDHFPDFPEKRILFLSGYGITYSKSGFLFLFKMIAQIPKIGRAITRERAQIKDWMRLFAFDWIISDNRLGFWHEKAHNVFITHQLNIQTGFRFTDAIVRKINYHYIHHFQECWIPDFSGSHNLSGILSHPIIKPNLPIQYMGPISRFVPQIISKKYDVCIVLSGPEPQRTILEEKLLSIIEKLDVTSILIRGLPGTSLKQAIKSNKITSIDYVGSDLLNEYVQASEIIISRAGYTSIMEWYVLNKKAIMIPTPGQTEQEYLSHHLTSGFPFVFIAQKNINTENIRAAINQLHDLKQLSQA